MKHTEIYFTANQIEKNAGLEWVEEKIDQGLSKAKDMLNDFSVWDSLDKNTQNAIIGGGSGLAAGTLASLFNNDWRSPLVGAVGGAGVGYGYNKLKDIYNSIGGDDKLGALEAMGFYDMTEEEQNKLLGISMAVNQIIGQ